MNEVTQVHLGRQAFTISASAHTQLRSYLAAIKGEVKDADVVDEVELRMAELLTTRGITGSKVVLPKDIDFLKSQLGDPEDFKDDSETTSETPPGRRLFRDTKGAMLAGVAAGLANYFGLDVLIIRILFVIGIFTGGWGILIYVALWLLVPEAKTTSERLQMAGKPVTLTSLKAIADRADVAGAAKRANNSLIGPINTLFRLILKAIGLALIVISLALLFALMTFAGYILVHTGNLFGQNIFPVGLREHILLDLVVSVLGLLSILLTIFGISIFKQKWPIKPWVTGTLVGLTFIGMVAGVALGADAAPRIRDRYNSHLHSTTRIIQPFTALSIVGSDVTIRYQESDQYAVNLSYFDSPDVANIKTTVSNGTLLIDSSQFNSHRNCQALCIPPMYNVTVTVESPILPKGDAFDSSLPPQPATAPAPPIN